MAQPHHSGGEVQAGTGATQRKPTSAYRKLRHVLAKTPLRTPLTWLQHRNLLPADVFFGVYPKSGSTWARFVLFELLSGMPAGFKATNQMMAGIAHHRDGLHMLPGGGRLIGTEEQWRKEYKRAIYMVRDARDVLLSEYAYLKALDLYRGDLDHFIKTFLFTCVTAYRRGPWHRHVPSWLDSPIAGTENLLVVRFEDMRKDPVLWFTRMVEFLGVDVDQEKIRLAVENNSIEKMREKENLEPVRASIKGRFVRNGAVRGWVSKLSPEQVRLIEEQAGSALLRLGYPLSSQLNADAATNQATMNVATDFPAGVSQSRLAR